MTVHRQVLCLLLFLASAIPITAKVTSVTNGVNIQDQVVQEKPKKKKKESFCDENDDTCTPSDTKVTDKCADKHEDCAVRAKQGECDTNSIFMLEKCKKSCFVCGHNGDIDMGVTQTISGEYPEEIKTRLLDSREYLLNVVDKDKKLRSLLDVCKLKHEYCAFWAVTGECEKNTNYMNWNCGPVCKSCEELSYEKRCPIDLEKMPNAWQPGDLNQLFTNITTLEEYEKYEPKVLSRPDLLEGDTKESADYQLGPWVVVLENVLSEQEAKRLIELGTARGYKQSYDVGKVKADGSYESRIHKGRTSTTAWCNNECLEDQVTQAVTERVSSITGIPQNNSEYLQLLRYGEGDFYQTHHDFIPEHKDRQSGVRLMTVFLYLNDVAEGGGTDFPELNITVQPKRGRVVLWPSVLDEDPDERDDRTIHQALPVGSGEVKYAVNAWIHRRNYRTPHESGCGSIVRHKSKSA